MATEKKRKAQRVAAPASNEDAYLQLNKLLLHLQDVREKLMYIQPDHLSDLEHSTWNYEVYKVGLAITATRGALLEKISDEFATELPALEAATDRLTDDLYKLKDSVKRIEAVANLLGIFDSIVKLVK